MATPHNTAPDGAFAKTVLMPGDPLRAKYLAENFLTDPKLVTSVRNAYGYTGTYKGVPVSIMASGMGMASIGIYSYELFKWYDVENIIRIGSAGSYSERLEVLDVVLVDSAYSESTYALYQGGEKRDVLFPSKKINDMAIKKAEECGIECKQAVAHSTDIFYCEPEVGDWKARKERSGSECVEMEAFALFHNANVLGKNAACLLTISDSYVSTKELEAEERQTSFNRMMVLALETAIAL